MLTYSKQGHTFFDDLVTFLSSVASLGIAFDAHRAGSSNAYKPTDYITIEGSPNVSKIELRFFPYGLMQILVSNKWPTAIQLEEIPITNPAPHHPLWLTGVQGLHGSMLQSAFVHYFETARPCIERKFGSNPQGWPAIWDFARVIRNAFAHGGEISFRNQSARSVSWRTLNYCPADNGRQILFQDITAVEVILLMEDMESFVS